MPITPAEFVARWNDSTRREQQGAQLHFHELVELVGLNPSTYIGTTGDKAVFEQHVEKAGGGAGRADVWYRERFAWEYKGKLKDLDSAYAQVLSYRPNLDNPPLLIVCDFLEYRIYPQWPNLSSQPIKFFNKDLLDERNRDMLRWALTDPDKIRHMLEKQRLDSEKLTENLANKFAHLSDLMRQHPLGETPKWGSMQIARFLTKLVFGLFTEDIGLLPRTRNIPLFRLLLDSAREVTEGFTEELELLFRAMNGDTNRFHLSYVPYFNGGIFAESADGAGDSLEVLDITEIPGALDILSEAADADWRSVNPTIFGTLFEGALDTNKRAQLGAHYTSEADIRLVIDPVLMSPLLSAWEAAQTEAAPLMQTFLDPTTAPKTRKAAETRLIALRDDLYSQLESTTVLDPACGSGNFLYVALKALKDLERKIRDAFRPLAPDEFRDVVTPRQLFGIEKDPFAAKLAHVVMWIGYLQWRYEDEGVLHWHEPRKHPHPRSLPNPIIQDKLKDTDPDRVTNDDAILRYDADGLPYEPAWPPAKIIIGNPPFLGGNKIRAELGNYVDDLFKLYGGRVPAFADLVTYWFERARAYIEVGQTERAGFISTNSIRGGTNRAVLDRIKQSGDIFMAWSDNEWVLSGAAVHISITGFDGKKQAVKTLNGQLVDNINPDLTSGAADISAAKPLPENSYLGFRGNQKGGAFDIDESLALTLLAAKNPSGISNTDVVKPLLNGSEITARSRNRWIIDFDGLPFEKAKQYEKPLEYVRVHVKPSRDKNPVKSERENWWRSLRSRPQMRVAIEGLNRYIVTPHTSKHRVFTWLDKAILPDHALIVFARDDDYFFGVLHSYLHEIWSLRLGTSLEDRPRYTPTTTFETFPFPYPPGQESVEKSALYHTPAPHSSRDSIYAVPTTTVNDTGRDAQKGVRPLIADGNNAVPTTTESGQIGDSALPIEGEGKIRAITAAAALVHAEREAWLNPADLIQMGADEKALKDRTLTNLYNAVSAQREGNGRNGKIPEVARKFAPRMADLHDALDAAVLAAYGWEDLIPTLRTPAGEEEVLRRLLAENQRRAGA